MTEDYNPVVDENLNKKFSTLNHVQKLAKIPPMLVMHPTDDKQVCFSLSLDMFEALRKGGNKVSGYFLSTGDHGFIKNPTTPELVDTNWELREKAIGNILGFFNSPNILIYLDNQEIEFEKISVDRDARKEHKEFLKSLNGMEL